jgi:hypothetical protein
LLNWGQGVVVVLVIAAVKLSSMTFWVLRSITIPAPSEWGTTPLLAWVLLLSAGAFVVIAGAAAMRLRMGQHALWIGAAMLYPYMLEFASIVFGRGRYANLLALDVTPLHLAILFLMPLVMAVLAVLIAARRRLASSGARLTHGS